jgi:SAM-dependent methyltransferase
MAEYWESRFSSEGAMWKADPSDSALKTLELFKNEKVNKILIPGFGYGRNANLFIESGFQVTGIEISRSAIGLARKSGINCVIHHSSVTNMPFDNESYEGIFCYALIHLLNKSERRVFLERCYDQLKPGGLMVFTFADKQNALYGTGKLLSAHRFEISKGLRVYFYDSDSVMKEFSEYGIIECRDINEPMKFMEGNETIKLKYVVCRKAVE